MTMLLALTVSIGLLAVVATWMFLGPLAAMNFQIWQAFIAWASFFHNGGKTDGLVKTVVCMSFGAVVGMLSVMLGALVPSREGGLLNARDQGHWVKTAHKRSISSSELG